MAEFIMRRRHSGLRVAVASALVAVGLGAGYEAINNKLGSCTTGIIHGNPGACFHAPNINLGGAKTTPESATAAVVQSSFHTKAKFSLKCAETVSVAVNVTAHKHDAHLGVQTGSGNVDKREYGEVVLCGNNQTLNNSISLTRDLSGKITSVDATVPPLTTNFARVNFFAAENCAPVRTGDSDVVAQKKIDDYKQKIASGKKVGCDDGFSLSGTFAVASVSRTINMGHTSAQLAMTVDAKPPQSVLQPAEQQIMAEDLNDLEGKYPGVPVTLHTSTQAQSFQDQLRTNLQPIAGDLKGRFPVHEFRVAKSGALQLYVEGGGGENATVDYTSADALHVTQAQANQDTLVLSQALAGV